MSNNLKLLLVVLLMPCVSNVYGQFIIQKELLLDNLSKSWAVYQQNTKYNLTNFSHRFFTDTVSIQEMKEAFYKNKDVKFTKSPYAGLDSVKRIGSIGESVMILSPLKKHPKKEIRDCRGVWNRLGTFSLVDLLDKNGVSQQTLFKKIKDEDLKKMMNGEIISLRAPRWYMGYVISPAASMEVYMDGKLIGRSPSVSYSDFFAYANHYSKVLDGEWYLKVSGGARLLGALQGMNTMTHAKTSEKSFSVLLYAKTYPRSKRITYTIDLLLPNNPDKDTENLFMSLKDFVESLPSGSFAPYYTTDLRLMTGRYYKVTVNKCGWLIQDYLDL
ncbi:DUF5030 domain-containing protein [Prevotella communis]|uniref:DUF5030 domain-containing protein n=1 Tax=Prevotella communis TaxID=2913614 RepID=UPI001EDB5F24|nr:DUF5030 domain-containing protein [Prevotella communis]UKK57250.1 DUF5030 domain-containing protein [Prevotella communis]UKK59959.1 DUF5030 domain-containing protein [Prevotella communis]